MEGSVMQWNIGSFHPDYGICEMAGTTGGEQYRWFVDEDGSVTMIPLDFLLSETPEPHGGDHD